MNQEQKELADRLMEVAYRSGVKDGQRILIGLLTEAKFPARLIADLETAGKAMVDAAVRKAANDMLRGYAGAKSRRTDA